MSDSMSNKQKFMQKLASIREGNKGIFKRGLEKGYKKLSEGVKNLGLAEESAKGVTINYVADTTGITSANLTTIDSVVKTKVVVESINFNSTLISSNYFYAARNNCSGIDPLLVNLLAECNKVVNDVQDSKVSAVLSDIEETIYGVANSLPGFVDVSEDDLQAQEEELVSKVLKCGDNKKLKSPDELETIYNGCQQQLCGDQNILDYDYCVNIKIIGHSNTDSDTAVVVA